LNANPNLTYYCVNASGKLITNTKDEGPNAVTWGIFPNREIVQPTIVETVSFLAWKDEAFRLGEDWAKCYPANSGTRRLIQRVMSECWLVNVVDNDFRATEDVFKVFTGLEVKDLDLVFEDQEGKAETNGHHTQANGTRNVVAGDEPVAAVKSAVQSGDPRKVPFQTEGKPGNVGISAGSNEKMKDSHEKRKENQKAD
jgi:hypothetical protein